MLGGVDNKLFFMSLAGFPAVLFLIFMLKWTSARGKSLVQRTPQSGGVDDYGT
ncbi:MAG: hypothetical protein RLZ23_469, partial [Actinomycetota bacterium]